MITNPVRMLLISMMLLFGVSVNTPVALAADGKQALVQQAQTTNEEEKTSPEKSDQKIDALEKALIKIEAQENAINELQGRAGQAEWIINNAIEARLDRAWMTLIKKKFGIC